MQTWRGGMAVTIHSPQPPDARRLIRARLLVHEPSFHHLTPARSGVINLPFSEFRAPFASVKVGERNELPEYLRRKIEVRLKRLVHERPLHV